MFVLLLSITVTHDIGWVKRYCTVQRDVVVLLTNNKLSNYLATGYKYKLPSNHINTHMYTHNNTPCMWLRNQ